MEARIERPTIEKILLCWMFINEYIHKHSFGYYIYQIPLTNWKGQGKVKEALYNWTKGLSRIQYATLVQIKAQYVLYHSKRSNVWCTSYVISKIIMCSVKRKHILWHINMTNLGPNWQNSIEPTAVYATLFSLIGKLLYFRFNFLGNNFTKLFGLK